MLARRLTPLARVRLVTAAIAGGFMLAATLALVALDLVLALGYLPGAGILLVLATIGVAAWRAEEAVATRSPLRWAWGSSWRAWLLMALAAGAVLTVIFRGTSGGMPQDDGGPPLTTSVGFQYALIVSLIYAPVPLLLGLVTHLAAAIGVRRLVRRRWRWFA